MKQEGGTSENIPSSAGDRKSGNSCFGSIRRNRKKIGFAPQECRGIG